MVVAGVAILAAIGLGAWALVLNDDLNDTEAQLDAQTAAAESASAEAERRIADARVRIQTALADVDSVVVVTDDDVAKAEQAVTEAEQNVAEAQAAVAQAQSDAEQARAERDLARAEAEQARAEVAQAELCSDASLAATQAWPRPTTRPRAPASDCPLAPGMRVARLRRRRARSRCRAAIRRRRRTASAPAGMSGSMPCRGSPAPAAAHQGRRRGPGIVNSKTSAMQVAPPYAACPEGNEEPTGWTRPSGGRGRPTRILSTVELSDVSASVTANATSASRRRLTSRTIPTAASDSAKPRPWPSALKTSATSVSSGVRMSCIASDQRRSTASGSAGTSTAISATTPSSAIPSQNARVGRDRKRSGGLASDAMPRSECLANASVRLDPREESSRYLDSRRRRQWLACKPPARRHRRRPHAATALTLGASRCVGWSRLRACPFS